MNIETAKQEAREAGAVTYARKNVSALPLREHIVYYFFDKFGDEVANFTPEFEDLELLSFGWQEFTPPRKWGNEFKESLKLINL